jgi:hypothetical protein
MGCVAGATFKSILLTYDNEAAMFRRVRKIFENTKNLGEMKFWEEYRWRIDVEKLRVIRYGSALGRRWLAFFFFFFFFK